MSLLLNPAPTQVVYVPEVDFTDGKIYTILKGGEQVTWKHILSTSYSNSSYTVSAPPPSPATVISRKVYQLMRVSFDIVGQAPVGQKLLQSGYWALRSWPLARNINTMTVSINNAATTVNMSDVIGPILLYNMAEHAKEYEYSMTPTELDESVVYDDLVNSVRNVLGSYIDSSTGLTHRGAFSPAVINNPDGLGIGAGLNVTAHVEFDICEPLILMSPLTWGRCEKSGLYGVQTFDLQVNWGGDLSRMLSFANGSGSVISGVSVNIGQPSLLWKYLTPQSLEKVPSKCEMNYSEINRYPTSAPSIPANTQVRVSSSNIQLKGIPDDLILCCRIQNSDQTMYTTDTFLPITQLSINFNNQSGLLSNTNVNDLYNISKANGLCQSFQEFAGQRMYVCNGSSERSFNTGGGAVRLRMGKDIGLPSTLSSGVDGTYQLQVDATVYNQRPTAVNATFYIITFSSGVWTVESGRSVSQTNVVSKLDVLNSEKSQVVKYKNTDQMLGGNIFEDIGDAISKGLSWVKDNVLPVARDVIPIVSSLKGLGMEGEEDYVGGAHYPRSALRRRLHR